jgi:effector-binding domain-containing protein
MAQPEDSMLDEPQIAQTDAQPLARIRLTIPRAEIRQVMGPGIGEVMATLAEQGVAPAGPWFTHHLRMDPAIFDFAICVPVAAPIENAGRVEPSELPAAKVVRVTYHGPYEGLPAAWAEFDAWIAEQRLATGPDLWERYVAGPESNADPSQWRTELNRPLAR